MKNAEYYLKRTDSAVRHLFNAVDCYLETLRVGIKHVFVSGLPYGPEQDAQYSAWCIENADALEEAKIARRAFRAETFALGGNFDLVGLSALFAITPGFLIHEV
ncbi:hypothetical protein [Pseudomonas sp. URMO17WK12:I11]|uniref:hypothetical protein n=1 Tax=Pseudomonas sp. URMO17WK12:I11 TaxID=1283291 RepID=UPI0011A45AF5|nr:hypothetical protein [Pseudomonas sp. URMO17WK12:I11]